MNLKISEQAAQRAVEQMHEGIQIVDRQWRYVYVNRAVCTHGRTTKEALLGRTMMECYPGIEKTENHRIIEQVMKDGKNVRVENEFTYPDGQKCWFELHIEALPDGVLVRSIDITDRKKLEEQLLHSQKLEAVGRLAGGVAHDFNNKLGVMVAYTEMALEKLQGTDPQIEGYLQKILTATRQSATLTRQLLAFSRKQVLDPKVLSMNSILADAKPTLAKLVGENVTLAMHLAPDLGNVRVDAAQIEQVILNLCINAKDAMPGGGALTIETRNVDLTDADAEAHPGVTPGRYVLLAVSDSGIGMDRATLAKIFEPFFTTKSRERGSGLGLSMVHGIVKQLQGHVWVYSEPQLGSVFKIYFRREDVAAEAGQPGAGAVKARRGHEGLLLVEDDESLRDAYEAALKGAGYQVMTAKDAEEAQALFARHGERIQLLVSDLVLPKANGRELSEKLKGLKPSLKVAFMSGYTENAVVHGGILDMDAVLMQKPISIGNLLDTVRAVLDGALKKGLV